MTTYQERRAEAAHFLWGVEVIALFRGSQKRVEDAAQLFAYQHPQIQKHIANSTFWAAIDLPLNFHPAATGARLVFTPIGAG